MNRIIFLISIIIFSISKSFATSNTSAIAMPYPTSIHAKIIRSAGFHNNSTLFPRIYMLNDTAYYHPETKIEWQYTFRFSAPKKGLKKLNYKVSGCAAFAIPDSYISIDQESKSPYFNVELLGHLKTENNVLKTIKLNSVAFDSNNHLINFECNITRERLPYAP